MTSTKNASLTITGVSTQEVQLAVAGDSHATPSMTGIYVLSANFALSPSGKSLGRGNTL